MAEQLYNMQVPAAQMQMPQIGKALTPPDGSANQKLFTSLLGGIGDKVMKFAVAEHDRRQKGLVDEAYLAARAKYEKWKADYNKEHQGSLALNAQADYEQGWQKIAQDTMKEYGERIDGTYSGLLSRNMQLGRFYSLHEGLTYQTHQEDVWNKNQLSVLDANIQMAINSGDRDRLQMEYKRYADHLERMFPGQDITPQLQKAHQSIAKGIIDHNIATGNYEAAQNNLNLFGGGALQSVTGSSGSGSTGQTGPLEAPKKGSLSERNLSQNNYGNIKDTSGGYRSYQTKQDGLMGVGERILRYTNAPERGWHAESIQDIIKIYAPASDGNNVSEYAGYIAKHMGVSPNEKLNFRDPKVLSGMIEWMTKFEHGANKVNVSSQDAMSAAQAIVDGKKPNYGSPIDGGGVVRTGQTQTVPQTGQTTQTQITSGSVPQTPQVPEQTSQASEPQVGNVFKAMKGERTGASLLNGSDVTGYQSKIDNALKKQRGEQALLIGQQAAQDGIALPEFLKTIQTMYPQDVETQQHAYRSYHSFVSMQEQEQKQKAAQAMANADAFLRDLYTSGKPYREMYPQIQQFIASAPNAELMKKIQKMADVYEDHFTGKVVTRPQAVREYAERLSRGEYVNPSEYMEVISHEDLEKLNKKSMKTALPKLAQRFNDLFYAFSNENPKEARAVFEAFHVDLNDPKELKRAEADKLFSEILNQFPPEFAENPEAIEKFIDRAFVKYELNRQRGLLWDTTGNYPAFSVNRMIDFGNAVSGETENPKYQVLPEGSARKDVQRLLKESAEKNGVVLDGKTLKPTPEQEQNALRAIVISGGAED